MSVISTVDVLQREGYVVLPDVLTGAEVDRIKNVLDPLLEATPRGRDDFEGTKTQRVYNLVGKTTAVHPLVEHLGVLDLVASRLGPGFQLSIAQAIRILPGETAQDLHTDDLPYPVPQPHQPLVVNTMWALAEFTKENGATRLVPRSFEEAERPPEDACVVAEMKPGSVLVWDGSLWHGGGANAADAARLGIAINYNVSWLRQQENQYLAIPREVVLGMSDRLRRLVGYDLSLVLGMVDGRHPLKTL